MLWRPLSEWLTLPVPAINRLQTISLFPLDCACIINLNLGSSFDFQARFQWQLHDQVAGRVGSWWMRELVSLVFAIFAVSCSACVSAMYLFIITERATVPTIYSLACVDAVRNLVSFSHWPCPAHYWAHYEATTKRWLIIEKINLKKLNNTITVPALWETENEYC